MLNLLSLSNSDRQLAAARDVLARLAEALDARFSIELWDGSRVPMGREVRARRPRPEEPPSAAEFDGYLTWTPAQRRVGGVY